MIKVILVSFRHRTLSACWTCCTSMDCKLNPGTFTSAVRGEPFRGSRWGFPLGVPCTGAAEGRRGTESADTPAGHLPGSLGRPALGAGHCWTVKMDTLKIHENWMVNGGALVLKSTVSLKRSTFDRTKIVLVACILFDCRCD